MVGIPKNIIGEKFTRILVVKDSGERCKSGEVFWECLCDCGTIKKIRSTHLSRGVTKSCGCLKKERAAELGRTLSGGIRWKNYTRIPKEILKKRKAGYGKKCMKRHRRELTPLYIRSLLTNGNRLKHADIPDELVQLKRVQVKIKRHLEVK